MYSKDLKGDLYKNEPKKLPPIINTVFSGITLIAVIILKIVMKDSFSWALFILCLCVIICFPISSWILSYFSKKQKTKTLKTYEAETDLIVKFMDYKKHYYTVQESESVKVTASFKETNDLNSYKYNDKDATLGLLDSNNAYLGIGVGFDALEINPETKEVINLKGLLTKSIWQKKHLKDIRINAKKAIVKINTTGVDIRPKTYLHINVRDDFYYDKKLGLLCIGDYHTYEIDDAVEFLNDAYLILRDDKVISLYINVGKDLEF